MDYCVVQAVGYDCVKVARLHACLDVVQEISETCKRRGLRPWLTKFLKWPVEFALTARANRPTVTPPCGLCACELSRASFTSL